MSEPTIVGDLALKIHADARGIEQEVAQSFGAAQRAAEASGARMVGSANEVRAAQLRILATTRQMARTSDETAVGQERLLRLGAALTRQYAELGVVQERAAARAIAPTRGIGVGGVVGLLGATFVAEKLVQAARSGAHAAAQLQAVQQQTAVTLQDTGDAAGVSADHIDKLAEAEARASGVSRTHVIAAQNLLATYTQIDNQQIFDRAARASVDLATAFARAHGTTVDVTTQARSLGIALQDPLHGLDRLRRSGVAFTDQQRAQVKALAESGQILQAQTLILDLVNQKVGGSAEAFGKTAAGAADRAREAYQEFSISLAKNVLPVATEALDKIVGIFDFFETHKGIRDASLALITLAGGFYAVHKAMQAFETLKTSQALTAVQSLFGYNRLERAQIRLAAAEDRHAEAAAAAALAERAQTTAMGGSTVATEAETVAQGGRGGLLGFFGRGRGIVAGEQGAAGLGLVGRLGGAATLALGAQIAGQVVQSQVKGSAGREAGSLIGDVGTGAAAGAALGSVVPVLGTAVGAGVGAAGGAIFAERHRIASLFGGLFGDSHTQRAELSANAQLEQQLADRHRQLAAAVASEVSPVRQARAAEQLLQVQHEQLSIAAYKSASAAAKQAQSAKDAADKNVQTAKDFLAQVQSGNEQALQQVEQVTGALGGLFEGGQNVPKQQEDAAKALQRQGDASTAVSLAEMRLAQVRSRDGAPSALSYARAEEALHRARRAGNIDAIHIAELRLAELRSQHGGPSAYALASAEDAVRKAKERDALASGKVKDAEDALNKTHEATALTIQQVSLTAAENLVDARQQAGAASRLVAEGITAPVLAQLEQLNKEAPGTLVRVAQGSTRAYVRTLNRDYSMREAARVALAAAWSRANVRDSEHVAAIRGREASAAYSRALALGLKSPEERQQILSALSALLGLQNLHLNIPGLHAPRSASQGTAGLPFAPIVVNGNVTLSTSGKVSSPVSNRAQRLSTAAGL